jgi:hypothetical protein
LQAAYHVSVPYVVFGVFGLAELVLMYTIMPETMGKPLVESLPPRGKKRAQDQEMLNKEEAKNNVDV